MSSSVVVSRNQRRYNRAANPPDLEAAVFHDPALILRCDVPLGWWLDGESTLGRLVFRPWSRASDRLVLTVVPSAAARGVSDGEWAEAARETLEIEDSALSDRIAPEAALLGWVAGRAPFNRCVVRGAALDVVLDHLSDGDAVAGLPDETLRRFASRTSAPARVPVSGTSREHARQRVEEMTQSGASEDIAGAIEEWQRAAEDAWLRSLCVAGHEHPDDEALGDVIKSRLLVGTRHAMSTLRAYAVLIRARPSKVPTQPIVNIGVGLSQAGTERLASYFRVAFDNLRRLQDLRGWTRLGADECSDGVVQQVLANLVTEEVRDLFADDLGAWGERIDPVAVRQVVDVYLAALSEWYPRPWAEHVGHPQLESDLHGLARAITAYADAANSWDLRKESTEAWTFLTTVGRLILEDAEGGADPSATQSHVVTGLIGQAGVLNRTADRLSLERALRCLDDAARIGSTNPADEINAAHNEALAAVQLGDLDRARRAMESGTAMVSAHLDDATITHQLPFFRWIERLLDPRVAEPGVVRSIPELQVMRARAEGEVTVLTEVCAQLDENLGEDPFSLETVEGLAAAASLVPDPKLAHGIRLAAEAGLTVQRLKLGASSQLRVGADDAVFARNLLGQVVHDLVDRGELEEAVAAADRARGRSLVMDLSRQGIDQMNPDVVESIAAISPFRIEATMRRAMSQLLRGSPTFARPLGQLVYLRRVVRYYQPLIDSMADFGPRPLDSNEVLATVDALGEPVLMMHPSDSRIALLLVIPGGAVHASWSEVPWSDVLDALEAFRSELGVWLGSRLGDRRGVRLPARRPQDLRTALRTGHHALIEPILEHLGDARSLTIIPYRELAAVPYALLEDRRGTPVIESLAISVAPSLATLATMMQREQPSGEAVAYVLGDPVTDIALGLKRLRGAAREADTVTRMIKATHPELPLIRRKLHKATVLSYRTEARAGRLVHLACHASVGREAGDSVLCLARGQDGESFLGPDDIAAVPLSDAIVFLAACRSGTGRPTADCSVGLARAFMQAGAAAVVGSYWNVDDEATPLLVERFYDTFLGGSVTVASALRDAMVSVRDALRQGEIRSASGDVIGEHPGEWGAFFVFGDGTRTGRWPAPKGDAAPSSFVPSGVAIAGYEYDDLDSTLTAILPAAEAGDATAMFSVGQALYPAHPDAARHWYEQAARAGHARAMFNLGAILEKSEPAAATDWYEAAASRGDTDAMRNLGVMMQDEDSLAARGWFEQAAKRGHAGAMCNLGTLLKESEPDAARDSYEQAAALGDTDAMNNLGILLAETQPDAAREWYERAANHGHPGAMHNLGLELVGSEPDAAREWWERAARAGLADSMYNLAKLSASVDPEASFKWYQRAADAGDAAAAFSLGTLLQTAEPERARYWYQQAADAGHAGAMNNLGTMLRQSHPETARSWFERAANLGNTNAMLNLWAALQETQPEDAGRWLKRAAATGDAAAVNLVDAQRKDQSET
jgi:TPR repeat protein/CHAT domain-containing protein